MMHVEAKAGRSGSAEPSVGGPSKLRAAEPGIEPAVIAAIALALELESQPEASRIALQRGPSFWALAGRARVLRGR